MNKKKIEKAAIVVVTIVLLFAIHIYTTIYTPHARGAVVRIIEVPAGASFGAITNMLVKEDIIKSRRGFTLLASIRGVKRKVKAGEYELSGAKSSAEVLDILTSGRVHFKKITFPEGYSIKDMVIVLKAENAARAEEFLRLAMDKEFAKSIFKENGIDAGGSKTLEGYLFPDTYSITRTMKAETIIRAMALRFKDVYERESIKRKDVVLGFTTNEIITLASIIEKETGVVEEMARISAVFHNRLKKGYRLQSDPTTIYGIANFNGNLTRKDLKTFTPYNTYKIYGLPPGPIASPGSSAIRAALNPNNEDYLYFVSRNDGTHKFSRTLKEHNRAVDYFQRGIQNGVTYSE